MHAVDPQMIREALERQGIEASVSLTEDKTTVFIEIATVAGNSHYWLGGFFAALQAIAFPFKTNLPLPF